MNALTAQLWFATLLISIVQATEVDGLHVNYAASEWSAHPSGIFSYIARVGNDSPILACTRLTSTGASNLFTLHVSKGTLAPVTMASCVIVANISGNITGYDLKGKQMFVWMVPSMKGVVADLQRLGYGDDRVLLVHKYFPSGVRRVATELLVLEISKDAQPLVLQRITSRINGPVERVYVLGPTELMFVGPAETERITIPAKKDWKEGSSYK